MEAEKNKLGMFSSICIFAAYITAVNIMPSGCFIGLGSKLIQGIAAIIVTWIVLVGLGVANGSIGQRTGMGASAIWKVVYGSSGFMLPATAYAVATTVWHIFDIYMFAAVCREIFPNHQVLAFVGGAIIVSAISLIGGIKGTDGVKLISNLTIPVAAALFIVVIVATIHHGGGLNAMASYTPAAPISALAACSLGINTWLTADCIFSDITKDCKNMKCVFGGIGVGFVMLVLILFVGMFGAMTFGITDIATLASSLGGVLFVITSVFVWISTINTCPTGVFLASNNYQKVFKTKSSAPFCWMICILGAVGACFVEYVTSLSIFSQVINVVALCFSPTMGATIGEYWFVRHGYLSEETPTVKWKARGLIALFTGFAVGIICTYVLHVPLTGVICAVVSFVVDIIIGKIGSERENKVLL